MTLQTWREPFVLCEDARPGGVARLFAAPVEIIAAHAHEEVAPALEAIEAALARGFHVAGWLGYEAGFAFEPRLLRRLKRRQPSGQPLLWFGVFAGPRVLSDADVEGLLPSGDGAWLSPPRPRMNRDAYDAAFARAHDYIVGGDIYQVNLSYRADVTLLGHPLAAYARLREAGQGGWSAAVHDGASWLLSTSPELFFRVDAVGAIEARPMKGTAKRHADPARDREAALALKADPKETAENVMIVDLLRNDLSRIAKKGSVRVSELFTVETYPTLHTLTSTVRAEVREECRVTDVLRALFPCGSITGAPKIRAMEIIDELEVDGRGAYTGSIGWIAPDGAAEFNVAIRTLAVGADGGAELGLGSAVVYDSTAAGEWEECRTKAGFVTAGAPTFELFETMRFDPREGCARFDLHMARLARSAATFGFVFERSAIEAALEGAADAACVVRLKLSADGGVKVETRVLPAPVQGAMAVALAPLPVAADDFRLRHKTSLRGFYDDARIAAGVDEVVFVDADGFVTEGSITNVFVERDGVLVTPPASRGLLPGVLRAALLQTGRAIEADLRAEDLARGFMLGNSVRGLAPASLVQQRRRRA